jgi:hypothetical protein
LAQERLSPRGRCGWAHAQLQRRLAWLEELLERAPLGNSLAGQRERAPRELFDIKTDTC